MRRLIAVIAAVLPGSLKLWILRLTGARFGRGVRIGFGTVVFSERLEMQDGASIGMFNVIRVNTLEMGKRSTILNLSRISANRLTMRSQSTICSRVEIAGDAADPRSHLYLGPASWILPHCYVNVARPIRFGRNVGVGGGSYLFTHGMWLSKLDGYPVAYGPITIKDDVWLPWGCFIMPGVTIESGVVVGACAVVTKDLAEGVLAAGVPAKVVRDRARIDLSKAERLAIIAEITIALAERRGETHRVEVADGFSRHYIGDKLVVLVQPEVPRFQYGLTLNVLHTPLPTDLPSVAAWSLADYASTPIASHSPIVRAWFSEARSLGVRCYPIDEDLD
jgi:acetyltransferase-like isoleucine patch superfamily enzyme